MKPTEPPPETTRPAAGGGGDADLVLRHGRPQDVRVVAALFTRTRRAAVPAMPPPVHTPEEDRAWLAAQLDGEREAWVAERAGRIVAFMLLEDDWLHSVYVRDGLTGQGIGTALVGLAKSLRPEGLQLWVFESNAGARRLYERLGFTVVERTDGAGNEEGAPDVRMVWDPAAGRR